MGTNATALAEAFKGSEFLKWNRENQQYYVDVSIGVAGLIASYNDKKQWKCIENWYAANPQTALDDFLKVMRKFPEYHPRGVVIAVLEKRCGNFAYQNR